MTPQPQDKTPESQAQSVVIESERLFEESINPKNLPPLSHAAKAVLDDIGPRPFAELKELRAVTASLQAENEEWKEKVLAKQEELIREIEKNLVLQAELDESRERNANLLELLVIEACAKKMGVA